VDKQYYRQLRSRAVQALRQHDAALIVTRFVVWVARTNRYKREQRMAVRIQKLLQRNLASSQVGECLHADAAITWLLLMPAASRSTRHCAHVIRVCNQPWQGCS
jgi:hypothetical protein